MGSDKEVLAALDFPIPCTVCRHPATGHVGDILKCGECDCSRSNPGGRSRHQPAPNHLPHEWE